MNSTYNHPVYRGYMDDIKNRIVAAVQDPNLPVEPDPYGDYMVRAMYTLMNLIVNLSVDLKDRVIDPSRLFDGINKKLTDLEKIIARFTAKYGDGGTPTEQEAKEFVQAVKDFKAAVKELEDSLPKDEDGNPIDDGSDKYNVWKQAKTELDAVLKTPMGGAPLEEYVRDTDPRDPTHLKDDLGQASRENTEEPSKGIFANWTKGTSDTPHQGFDHFGTKLTHLTEEYLDEAGEISTKMKIANDVTANIIKTANDVNMAKIRNSKQM